MAAYDIRMKAPGLHRLRVGDDRVIDEIRDTEPLVVVIAIGHRRDVYR